MSTKKEVRELQIRREGRKSTKITGELDRGQNRDLQYYLGKNYPILIYSAEEGGYVAEIEELPGCITQGETLEEISDRINNARQLWIEVAYEDGVEIPLPRTEHEYSGKFVVRIPTYLHRRLVEQATREGVSLNQYVETILTAGTTCADMKNEIKEVLTTALVKKLVTEGTPGFGHQTGYIGGPRWTLGENQGLLEVEDIKFSKDKWETRVAV
ncbi:type II toxin-antitoxin system HicB family antitoxin [Chloroflexota bacterium]